MSERYRKQRRGWDWSAFSLFILGALGVAFAPEKYMPICATVYFLGMSGLLFRIYILRNRNPGAKP